MVTAAEKWRELALKQLDEVIAEYTALVERQRAGTAPDRRPTSALHRARTDVPDPPSTADWVRSSNRSLAAVQGLAPGSTYDKDGQRQGDQVFEQTRAHRLIGIVQALRVDVAAGYIDKMSARIRGELFSDFLEMAQHLLDQGYKDPAAVVAGSALEEHLRQMCLRAGIDLLAAPAQPKKADVLNADLAKAGTCSKLEQKDVTAWLGLRNSAAHGKYSDYDAGRVGLMIAGIREFISRHPA